LKIRQAIILAGGKGTRLRERLGDLPKPLIDICGLPLLERQILLLKSYGYERLIILVNYQAEKIADFCEKKSSWGLQIQCIDDGEPRGTAGAVLQVLHLLDDEFLVVYGDTIFEVDLDRFETFHLEDNSAAATLFLHPNDHPQDSDLVGLDINNRITNFYPYPHSDEEYFPNLVNAALYLMRKRELQKYVNPTLDLLDFGKQIFPSMIADGLLLRGYNSPEYIKDCGTPKRLDKVICDFNDGKIQRSILALRQSAVFIDRDGTINKEVGHLHSANELELFPWVGSAIRRLNYSDYKCCVVTNQPVIARGECSISELIKIHNKMETLLGSEGAYIDRIYYCPHHPDKGFEGEVTSLKVNCNCRKPALGMIQFAQKDLNLDLERSWVIGDTSVDIETAKRAGIRSILVETGYAGMDCRYHSTPDYIVPNLSSAVNFILDVYPHAFNMIKTYTSAIEAGDMVLIGGFARSGKSSIASLFKDVLKSQGIRSHIISTDRWILSEEDRHSGVLGRHNVKDLREFYQLVSSKRDGEMRFSLPAYIKKSKQHVPDVEEFIFSSSDVLIFEGVLALTLDDGIANNTFRYVVKINEEDRHARILHEYKLRGFDSAVAQEIYEQRRIDENLVIEDTCINAIVIDSIIDGSVEMAQEGFR
jgi:histidinol-phosphate phosphatase family protein